MCQIYLKCLFSNQQTEHVEYCEGRGAKSLAEIRTGSCKFNRTLKELSHEIDFKNLQKFTEPGLTKRRSWFLNFLGAPMILKRKK
jgi:hypothetical protein